MTHRAIAHFTLFRWTERSNAELLGILSHGANNNERAAGGDWCIPP